MGLCGYEVATLKRIATGDVSDDPGAAFCTAVEFLTCGGYLKDGKLTAKGDAELRLGMMVDLCTPWGEI